MKCPDFGLAAVSVTVGTDSLVRELLITAAGEWHIDPEEVELSFDGDTLCETKRLADHGVVANSEIEMCRKQFRLFGKCWFVDDTKQEKLHSWLRAHNEEYLCLDSPTFSEDGCLSVGGGLLPSDAERVSFRSSNSTTLDLTGLSSLTFIGDGFLRDSQITALDFSSLSDVTTIGSSFLYFCTQLTALDLSGLSSVTAIGDAFLFCCSRITALDLSCCSGVTDIGEQFLYSCEQLTTLDLSGLGITILGKSFLENCSELTALDLSGLSSVTAIGNSFVYSCSKITALDLSSLSNVTEIGGSFLSNCYKLESIKLPENNAALFERAR